MIDQWKKALLEEAPEIFERSGKKKAEVEEETVRSLHTKIGELAVANDFLSRKLKPSTGKWGAARLNAPTPRCRSGRNAACCQPRARRLPTPAKSWKIGVDTTTKTDPTARSDTTSRLPCIVPMAPPARHRETAGKIQLPAIQGWGAGHCQHGLVHPQGARLSDIELARSRRLRRSADRGGQSLRPARDHEY